MATKINYGPAGSYKSSSAVWFELLPALRQGRCVVTNVEGLYPLKTIERVLGEKFPDSARLYRISSLTARGRRLWRCWYHWMPIGSYVLMDEAQDIYSLSGWRPEELDFKPIDFYSDVFSKSDLVSYFKEVRSSFRPVLDDSSTDDLGEVLFDADGLILYPLTFDESFKRHRKYNWDITLCTPNISDIHKSIRGVAEVAVSYSSKDHILFCKRKPRLFEHSPMNRRNPTKTDPVYSRYVPWRVHELYKSTQTGQATKSGASSGIFSSTKFNLMLFVFFLALGTFSYLLYHRLHSSRAQELQAATGAHVQDTSGAVVQGSSPRSGSSVGVTSSADTVQVSAARPTQSVSSVQGRFLMPFNAADMSLSGISCRRRGRSLLTSDCESVFSATVSGRRVFIQSLDLMDMGYRVFIFSPCKAGIYDSHGGHLDVFCEPSPEVVVEAAQNRVKLEPAFVSSSNQSQDNQYKG